MATRLKPVDIVIVGMGWTGGIMAKELAATGLSIVALERGGKRDTSPDFMAPGIHDELRYAQRNELMQDVVRDTVTFRNSGDQAALPMRRLGSFLPGEGVGGAGVHWNGATWRWQPWDQEALTRTRTRKAAVPDDMLLADWGVSYAELEPHYDAFEKLCAISGKAGNLKGKIMPGGNPFEGPRENEYPTPPLIPSHALMLFDKAATSLGYHPYMSPAANASTDYVNPDGIPFGACHYCGFCERFGCEANAKASPNMTVVPLALAAKNFELRTNARVMKINLDAAGTRAVSVTYLDVRGVEIEQPAELVLLCAFTLGNVHQLLLSGIGKPYDPKTGEGVVGRSYAYQMNTGANAFFDEKTSMNPFMGSGGLQMAFDDFAGDNVDPATMGFIGGSAVTIGSFGGRPIGFHPVPDGTPRWGSAWKRAVVDNYDRTALVRAFGSVMAYRGNYLDLDPTYRDPYGRPLLRMTFDFHENEQKKGNAMADVAAKVAQAMGAVKVDRRGAPKKYSIVPYQSTHNTGGAIMGTDPKTSALNRYLQVWDVPNVFVMGGSALPHNAEKNPTGPIAALTLWAAEAIKSSYLKKPGPLVPV